VIRYSRQIVGPFALVIVCCARGGEPQRKEETSRDSAAIASAVPVTEPAVPAIGEPELRVEAQLPPASLTCYPTNFGPTDTLTLRMNVPHGDYLIATQPGDSLFYVIYPQRNVPSRKYSLIPPEEFKQMETLKLPADVKAVPWYYGRDTTLAPLFPRSGKYVLTMGENLAGDNARGASCTVFFGEKERR
jgi:hypothetical protein